jgi:hypothetical protein
MFEETGDEVKSQGWTPIVIDTNGNGKRDEYVEPGQPVDLNKDKRVAAATSIATACSGRRSRAGISAHSIAGNARSSTGRAATGKHCPEGWTLKPG